MVTREFEKLSFFFKVVIVTCVIALMFFVVWLKDDFVKEFCICPPCNNQKIEKNNSLWEDFIETFCICPPCD